MTPNIGPLGYQPEMKKLVTSSPTVTLMVTRIPSTITEEGLENIFRDFHVLCQRLCVNKGGFAGVRGLNYAYVTLASNSEADLAIEKLNMQPPLNLGVRYKPSEEERVKAREQDLLNRAFPSNPLEEKRSKTTEQDVPGSNQGNQNENENIFEAEHGVLSRELEDECEDTIAGFVDNPSIASAAGSIGAEAVFMFNSPLSVSITTQCTGGCCSCGGEAMLVCSKCTTAWYCSQRCQVKEWPGHKGECGGQDQGLSIQGEESSKKIDAGVRKRKVVTKVTSYDDDKTGSPRSTEDSPPRDTVSIESKESEVRFGDTDQQLFESKVECKDTVSASQTQVAASEHVESTLVDNFSSTRSGIGVHKYQTISVKVDEINILDSKEKVIYEDAQKNVDAEEVAVVELSVESEEESSLKSLLMFKKEGGKGEPENNVTDEQSAEAVPSCDQRISLPLSWVRIRSCEPDSDTNLLHLRIEGLEEAIQVRLERVRPVEPWGEIKGVLDMVVGEGRGQIGALG